jgi:hypothetical protein
LNGRHAARPAEFQQAPDIPAGRHDNLSAAVFPAITDCPRSQVRPPQMLVFTGNSVVPLKGSRGLAMII